MVVNIEFASKKNTSGVIAKKAVSAVSLSGNEMKMHEQIMEYRNRVCELDSNLKSAMASLASANQDIDSLNGEIGRLKEEISRLTEELKVEREKNARSVKSKKSQKQTDGSED